MNGLLAVVLVVPLVGALGVVAAGRRAPLVVVASGVAAALGWAVVVSAASPPELGRISVDPVLAAALVAAALLVAARRPTSTIGACGALCAVTLLAATAGSGGDGLPDRPLAAGVVALTLLTVLRLRADAHRPAPDPAPSADGTDIAETDARAEVDIVAAGFGTAGVGIASVLALAVGGLAVAVGAAVDDTSQAAVAVVVGTGLVLLVSLGRGAPGALLVPAALLAVARVLAEVRAADGADGSVAAVAAVGALVVAVATTVLTRREPTAPGRPTLDRVGVVTAAAAVVLLAQDLPDARAAGLLLAAGAVGAFVTTHPVGLVALLPGLVATLQAFAPATEPVHAAAAGAVALLAVVGTGQMASGPFAATHHRLRSHWPAALSMTFGVVPLWGWTAASLDDLVRAVGTAAAFALPFAVGALALAARRALTTAPARTTGRISARRVATASPDGTSHHDRS